MRMTFTITPKANGKCNDEHCSSNDMKLVMARIDVFRVDCAGAVEHVPAGGSEFTDQERAAVLHAVRLVQPGAGGAAGAGESSP